MSKYYKGNLILRDIDEKLDDIEKQRTMNFSTKNKININNTDLDYDEQSAKELIKSKNVYENIVNKAREITTKIKTILEGCENY